MKFLHLADCHLDAPFVELGQLLNKSNARRYELKETFDKAIELAKQEKVDAIFIAGDFFEQKYVTKSTINFLNSKFMEIPNIQVFISPGNHDPFINNSYYICLLLCLFSMALYVCGHKKAGTWATITVVVYFLLRAIKGVIL
jgi:DNA repair exonuclease SbcCD nuclease subunit